MATRLLELVGSWVNGTLPAIRLQDGIEACGAGGHAGSLWLSRKQCGMSLMRTKNYEGMTAHTMSHTHLR